MQRSPPTCMLENGWCIHPQINDRNVAQSQQQWKNHTKDWNFQKPIHSRMIKHAKQHMRALDHFHQVCRQAGWC